MELHLIWLGTIKRCKKIMYSTNKLNICINIFAIIISGISWLWINLGYTIAKHKTNHTYFEIFIKLYTQKNNTFKQTR